MMNTRGKIVAGALVTILVVGAFVAPKVFGGSESEQQASAGGPGGGMPPMPVDVDTARQGDVVDAVRATGRIEALQAVELRPDEQGRVVALLFREGQRVAKGTPLVRIDDALLRAQAERAAADRDLARQQLERVRRLRAENAASPADLERVEAAARSAEAALAVLELQIERTTVRAPFSGSVGQRFVSMGDYVTPSTPLLTLQTTDPQRAVIEVPERYAADLRPGQEIEFTVAAHPGRTFRAQVDFIDPVVQEEGRTIVVKARAPNPDQALKSGMFIEARLAVTTRAGAIVVPEDAVQPLRTANVVWAVVDGKASRRVVQLGTRSEGVVEVLSGVEPGELVVVGGLERMGEGMPVAPRPRGAPPDSGAAAPAPQN
ncbi:MAG TPA: efflux RND transporter periplasmic adaptor subunit [Gemmatimonadales bacterium]|nr:efflux RND transporter periplasmic adaptor subunit [Gemmatimonadales bacterium]